MLKILFKADRYKKYLKDTKKFYNKELKSIMNKIGTDNIKQTKIRLYSTKQSPDSSAFKPLSPRYAEWKRKYHGSEDIGILSGKMARSNEKTIEQKGKETILTVGNTARSKGFPYPYVFQYGSVKQASRPFVGFSDKESNNYFKRLAEAVEKI
jgi:beta-lactamase class A